MGPGEILHILRAHPQGLTKSEIALRTGLARTTVNQRLGPLIAAGLVVPSPEGSHTGGRPADRFVINDRFGVVLAADMGASGLRVALCDMNARVLAERSERSDITTGPVVVLSRVAVLFGEMLDASSVAASEVRGIGIDVPGPVDHDSGRVITPPIMTGWHDFDIPGFFRPRFACPVMVENDVNAMAFGEHRLVHPDTRNIVFVKIGTGIGTGIIVDGRIYRGSDGAAGDVGHIQIEDNLPDRPLCRCGRFGCVEAHAGGWALLRDLKAYGVPVDTVADVVQLMREGHPEATRLYRRAAMVVGTAVSDIINLLNPRIVVLGGQLASVDDFFFAGVREVVYRRSLPLATRSLQIVASRLGENAGVHGLARLVLDEVSDPGRVDTLLGVTR
jgi:predicted NBD/HSP70 family sugar kinase